MAYVTAVNISEKKGVRKHAVPYVELKRHHGIVGDAHAGDWHRQISLLADETAEAEVTQIGKQCHNDCQIKRTAGKCVMPTEGIFAIVIKEGRVKAGDEIEVLK